MIKASVRCERCLDSYVNDVLNYDTSGCASISPCQSPKEPR